MLSILVKLLRDILQGLHLQHAEQHAQLKSLHEQLRCLQEKIETYHREQVRWQQAQNEVSSVHILVSRKGEKMPNLQILDDGKGCVWTETLDHPLKSGESLAFAMSNPDALVVVQSGPDSSGLVYTLDATIPVPPVDATGVFPTITITRNAPFEPLVIDGSAEAVDITIDPNKDEVTSATITVAAK